MAGKRALLGHPQGKKPVTEPVIDWGKTRRTPCGPLAELLESAEFDSYVQAIKRRYDWSYDSLRGISPGEEWTDRDHIESFMDLWESLNNKLGEWHIDFQHVEEPPASVFAAVGDKVARAWTCLAILADRGCPLLRSESPRAGRRRRAFPRPTAHLVRPGGFTEPDLAWMAGIPPKHRARRVRVRAKLEELGIIRRVSLRGKQVRYVPTDFPPLEKLDAFLKEIERDEVRSIGDLIRDAVPRRRPEKGAPERWGRSGVGQSIYVVGAIPSPAAWRFIERQTMGLRTTPADLPIHGWRGFPRLSSYGIVPPRKGEQRDESKYRKWLGRTYFEGKRRPALVIPL